MVDGVAPRHGQHQESRRAHHAFDVAYGFVPVDDVLEQIRAKHEVVAAADTGERRDVRDDVDAWLRARIQVHDLQTPLPEWGKYVLVDVRLHDGSELERRRTDVE